MPKGADAGKSRYGKESRHAFEYDAAKPNECRYCGRTRQAHKDERERARDRVNDTDGQATSWSWS